MLTANIDEYNNQTNDSNGNNNNHHHLEENISTSRVSNDNLNFDDLRSLLKLCLNLETTVSIGLESSIIPFIVSSSNHSVEDTNSNCNDTSLNGKDFEVNTILVTTPIRRISSSSSSRIPVSINKKK